VVAEADLPPPAASEAAPPERRRVYIRKEVELKRYGYTDHCPGCLGAAANQPGTPHSEACRARIEHELRNDAEQGGQERLAAASQRRAEQQAGDAAEAAAAAQIVPPPGLSAACPAATPAQLAQEAADVQMADPVAPRDVHMPALRAARVQPRRAKRSAEEADLSDQDPRLEPSGPSSSSPGANLNLLELDDTLCTGCGLDSMHGDSPFSEVPGGVFDMKTGFDFNLKSDRERVKDDIANLDPGLVIGSSHCQLKSREAQRGHLDFFCETYQQAIDHGKIFVHQHLSASGTWGYQAIRRLLNEAYVGVWKSSLGWWVSNSKAVLECLRGASKDLLDGPAELFTPEVARSIRHSYRAHRQELWGVYSMDTGAHVEEPEVVTQLAGWAESKCIAFYDDITGAKLPPDLVRRARIEEMDFMKRLKVYEYASVTECHDRMHQAPIPVRWCDVNKGDAADPEIRSRLVLQETRHRSPLESKDVLSTFAATPPLEAIRALASLCVVTYQTQRRVLRLFDISRAHPHCPPERELYI